MELFRQGAISAAEVAHELGISRRRAYDLRTDYLRACAQGTVSTWKPGCSGGNHKAPWPDEVCELLRRRLSSKPPSPYSFAASEALRLHQFHLDRAQVRQWAIRNGLAHAQPARHVRVAERRWARKNIGELWQFDASPHAWFPAHDGHFAMLNMLDDCSRLFVGSTLYGKENLLAYFDFLPSAFLEHGLPLVLYVDYHSFFFPQNPDALTELGKSLKFYEVSFQYASSPQAKGKIEREHQYWQKRLPPLFAAENIRDLHAANLLLSALRHHRNDHEPHRELGMTASSAWNTARQEGRSSLRPAKPDAWWPFVWSLRQPIRVADDGRVPIGLQRIRLDIPPRTRVVLCHHPSGHHSIIAKQPNPSETPILLFSNRPR